MKSLPSGKRTNDAILKHCFPNGIPIIVIQKITPEIAHPIPISIPNNINQMILATGCFVKCVVAWCPNGVITKLAILNNCYQNGIPMIVMQKIIPPKHRPIASQSPIRINQIILPIVFIINLPSFLLYNYM